jgi:hypothetical protein
VFFNLSRPNFGIVFFSFLLRRECKCWLYSFSVSSDCYRRGCCYHAITITTSSDNKRIAKGQFLTAKSKDAPI